MENLFPLIIFALIAVASSWLKKRRESGGDDWVDSPGTESTSTPPRAKSWEDQMRDLLAGQSPAAPPQREDVPVAIPIEEASPSYQSPAVTSAPPPILYTAETESTRVSDLIPAAPVVEAPAKDLFAAARAAIDRASGLDDRVQARMDQVSSGLGRKKKRRRRRLMIPGAASLSDIDRAMDLVSSPEGVRSAIIASMIIGPPKALE